MIFQDSSQIFPDSDPGMFTRMESLDKHGPSKVLFRGEQWTLPDIVSAYINSMEFTYSIVGGVEEIEINPDTFIQMPELIYDKGVSEKASSELDEFLASGKFIDPNSPAILNFLEASALAPPDDEDQVHGAGKSGLNTKF